LIKVMTRIAQITLIYILKTGTQISRIFADIMFMKNDATNFKK